MEDEIHFVARARCPFYKMLRQDLKSKIHNTNIDSLEDEAFAIWLLTNEDKYVCKAVG